MSQMLPNMMNYEETYSQIPDGLVSTQIVLSPVNGSTFAPSSVIQFDLLSRGMIVPDSVFLRYKWATTSVAGGGSILGTPVYAPIARLETIIGSQVVETINQYNQCANMLVNLTSSVASKYGMMSSYGYATAGATPAMAELDGRLLPTTAESGSFSGLLPGLITNSTKLLPLFAMGQVRVQLTLDTLANFTTTALPIATFSMTNVELIYTMVDPGQRVEQYVRGLGTFHIKSQSFTNSSVSLGSGTSGTISLVFNQRLASIKSAFVLFTPTGANGINKSFDSVDPTASNGEISLNIGGITYPARPLSTINNRNGILQYLRNAVGSLYDKDNSMSINNVEWNYLPTVATTVTEPSKFIVGIDLERLHTDSLLSGTSTENSAITLLLQSNTATNQIYNVNLILAYDAIIECDTNSRQVSIKQ